jgi:hypothetical protein
MSFMSVQMARRGGHNGPIDDGLDRAVTVRPSSTANFFVDSLDKNSGTSSDFVINKNQSLFNGFFNRIAVNEVVMDWGLPNVAQWWGNNFLTVLVNPGGGATTGVSYTITIPDGFYSMIDLMRVVCSLLNAAPGQTATFSVDAVTNTQVGIKSTQAFAVVWEQAANITSVPALTAPYYLPQNALARGLFSSSQLYQLGIFPVLVTNPLFTTSKVILAPLVLGTRYIDFVSPQLTYNQQLKDNTTAQFPKDVLYRWYFAWDTQSGVNSIVPSTPPAPTSNALFPYYVYQGYAPFNQRRILPYPKQILWDNSQPIGQVGFQVYDDRGRILDTTQFTPSANFQFQMSMLLSEN